ncbi:glycosyltransferase family 4 protein [Marinicella sp. S1101]|uniref:glycosyltransferase family 4 protein n=1 Tax=Marinicella marina TaxID=2996016 RepID=UPI002261043B|nr:glycosyltransferase family 4 protein [Marinicella marina]MCX7554364.1 glycosyltransferase family 4 protein [Marinicella marina]MDJ1138645.1 glycosyltransferase family 4 protein [Marinicella marina]
MAHIFFADTTHPKPYGFAELAAQAMGGTESSVLRTAAILAKNDHAVTVFQQARDGATEHSGIQFIGPQQLATISAPDHVVVLRKFPQLKVFEKHFPKASFHLWIHTYKNWEYSLKRAITFKPGWQLITNSKTHAADCDRLLNRGLLGQLFNLFKAKIDIKTCYNPIPASLADYPAQARNTNKLLFLSAPNKGLAQTLRTFQQINRHLKDLKLYVANPGYRDDQPEDIPNVHYLGALPAAEVKAHIASSLCVFYPQNSFAETFGLIYAEANALGTPVLAHDIGAAREILHPSNVLIDAEDNYQITKTLVNWQRELPQVSYRHMFDDESVYSQWLDALGL